MLDQNTDRMWYVIGALVVGAGIIFLGNNAFPTIFASVGEGYTKLKDKAVTTISGITINSPTHDNALIDYAELLNNPDNWMQGGISNKGESSINNFVMRTDYLPLEPGTYVLKITTERPYNVAMSMSTYMAKADKDGSHIGNTLESHNEHVFVVPENANYTRLRVLYHHPDMVSATNRNGWVKDEWDPQVEVPLMTFELSRRLLAEDEI